jgi:hypothetical protein
MGAKVRNGGQAELQGTKTSVVVVRQSIWVVANTKGQERRRSRTKDIGTLMHPKVEN